jgi:sodium/pantothenate symporter
MVSEVPILLAQAPSAGSNAALVTFIFYTLAVFALAGVSSRLLRRRRFLSEYFLGSRGLGMWAFALTFAATSASGGSFTGFPSKIYTHGWVLALWIGSYMMVPVLTMGLLGKRLNQVARTSGSITIPDVLRSRCESVALGALATGLIVFFLAFNLVAQFKAGALILSTLLDDVPLFQLGQDWTGELIAGSAFLGGVQPGYLLCLLAFAAAVISYTTYGGFRAVVWTDVLQGLVMVGGVLVMLPLALGQVGGLGQATDELSKMTPPRERTAQLEIAQPQPEDLAIPFGTWLEQPASEGGPRRVFRTAQRAVIPSGQRRAVFLEEGSDRDAIKVLEITTPEEVARIETPPRKIPIAVRVVGTEAYKYGADTPGVYVTGPGPSPVDELGFLPLGLAVSFFFMWTFAGAGQPGNMVRLMAFKSSQTFKRGIFTVVVYYSLIYFPLVIIFCCARVLLPGMEIESDRIMPAMAEHLTLAAGWPWLAGLLVAAPFAAVMSTVDSFLLMISSAVVRDVYHRHVNPGATEKTLRRLSYAVTLLVGIAAVLGALYPPRYLQDIIVYTGSGLASCFLVPMALGLYWPRLNTAGAITGMLSGFLTHLGLYGTGFVLHGRFQAFRIANLDPLIPALVVSLMGALLVTLITSPPPEHLVRKFFYRGR